MKTAIIFTTLLAAFVAANPVKVEQRQTRKLSIPSPSIVAHLLGTTRVLLARDDNDTAVQANIPADGSRVSIRNNFGNLGNPVQANRGNIVSGSGSCRVFRDAGATQQVGGTLNSNGNSVSFGGLVNLNNGVIICQ
ncbi:hypothetical protein CC78DRAFT_565137 [Lojkania enalia]|uniref:Curlin n=1 Tax=Lojkania enalia TaxID=147567 RepID=A0A9P4N9E9_9PLEO|nr:hypothetical protein CC78DRAFT_565137 [Didymosphaeria enalia]